MAEPRSHAVEGVPGAEPALLALQLALSRATSRTGDWAAQARHTERVLVLAEDLDDWDALAQAHIQMGLRYPSIGAPWTGLASYATALNIGREHDLPGPMSRALVNLASAQNSRNLPAALAHAVEAIEVSRRAGLQSWYAFAILNHLIGLWTGGRYDEARQQLAEAHGALRRPVSRGHPGTPSTGGSATLRGTPCRTETRLSTPPPTTSRLARG